ncbi:4'-phosphopantetheinyl transferase family protein [Tuwongella immobilis]|uniref:4'-phosphopantetheinyl transferase domain-containing protein n=1 Tax=Tuwongella immobilis TaxID=692036 RepID=A0A6C2YPD2_9BACT|nr:4'-phosphopantetheinyl transferase superfamily protein [Tuwongella immobilis]VIP03217.1 4 -phosphopantetheinyl transferase : 4'-phosphopantetheinyl transferase OS=Cylindrospermopsis raciborskii CS-505 GN=CRC_01556 PE=4 SV=1: ACPS [Tuwongella immobilis]VTS03739.1 4 -phosphopantetheinyl transferase : 4'-phosphopantetheinyl transferase OS=Cylindrospermopsis raciborskii CS-505 GN=CRC_01556 PE=4 SV=1: ACPS [Tuwongella immobilis]
MTGIDQRTPIESLVQWEFLSDPESIASIRPPSRPTVWLAPLPISRDETVDAEPQAIGFNASEWQRAARYRVAAARHQFIRARSFLRQGLAAILGCDPDQVPFEQAPQQKPRLGEPFRSAGWDFNLSHTSGWVMLGVTATGRIGVDCERIRNAAFDALLERFFAAEEWAEWQSATATENREQLFYQAWTRKEAVVKALSRSVQEFAQFAIPLCPPRSNHWVRSWESIPHPPTVHLDSQCVQDQLFASVAWLPNDDTAEESSSTV